MNRPLFRKLSLLSFVLFVLVPGSALAQDADNKPDDVKLQVQTADGRTRFQIGEVITLNLSFTSRATDKYRVGYAPYDHRGPIDYEKFQLDPQEGWSDPLRLYFSIGIIALSGPIGSQVLSQTPTVIPLDLNEWVRFEKPGKYSLRVVSNRVSDLSNNKPASHAEFVLTSNELQITITAPTKSWQDDTLKTAVATLDRVQPYLSKATATEIEKAGKALSYLGTPDSLKEMARRLAADDSSVASACFHGLVSAYPKDAIPELQRLMPDPDYPVTQHFFFALSALQRTPDQSPGAIMEEDVRNREIIMENLRPVVSRKRGKALAVTLTTIVEMTNRYPAKSEHISDAMVAQIISIFDQLPIEKQGEMLGWGWQVVESPAFLPILRKYAQEYKDFPVPNISPAPNSLYLTGRALTRWYELEPNEARKVIIKEIVRPKPRYSADVLGILPDETLPEVEHALAAHFAAAQDRYGWLNPASLINRYAGDSILPQVLPVVDKQVGKWSREIQEPILAYLLRVDPATARPRFEAAIAARGPGYSECNRSLFTGVGALYQDPLLEELAIGALNDSDPEVAGNAATYLGKYGSNAAEEKLWERMTRWNAKWIGREYELSSTTTEVNPNDAELRLGEILIQAITTAKSWTVDESKLRRLRQQVILYDDERSADNLLEQWGKKPWAISFENSSRGPHFRIFNYEASSIKAIEEKLSQFPAGSIFEWKPIVGLPDEEEANRIAKELSEFLSSHGMKLIIPGSAGILPA